MALAGGGNTTAIAGCVFADCTNTHPVTDIFVDPTNSPLGFRLKTTSPISPAIDKGLNTYAGVPGTCPSPDDQLATCGDFEGFARPLDGDGNAAATVDIGASEAPAVVVTYTLTYTAGANGTISGASPQTVNDGASGTLVTAVPNAGYHFTSWSDGVLTAARTDSNVHANISVTASFAINTYTLTYTAGLNGSISGTSPQTVNDGASGTTVTAVADAGYHFTSWSDGVLTASRTDSNVHANITVVASFAANTYTLTYTAGANGSISGTSPQTVNDGGSGSAVTAVADAGYHFTSWSDGVLTASRTDSNVHANLSVTASFAINTYTLTYTAGTNGSISGTSPQTVNDGGSGSAVTAVADAGYHFTSWSDGVLTASRTDSNVHANLSVTASFAINTYTLTYTAGANGSISGTSPQTVNDGGSGSAVTAVADAGYHFTSWSDGVLTASRTDSNVHANLSVTASFAINTYTLTYTAGANGSISGTSPQTVNDGGSGSAVTAVADAGYHFTSWSDGVLTASRTDSNVHANLNVTASFAIDTTTNAPPVITGVTGPAVPVAKNTQITVTATFTDANYLDTHTCTISWDDLTSSVGTVVESNGSGSCIGSHIYTAAGVYEPMVTVTDNFTAWDTDSFQYVVVYDIGAGFVTGGGWIDSKEGYYVENTSMTGKANFGFVSKYKPGMTVPTGETEFNFNAAGFRFNSTAYEWLVVSGAKAQYKGTGTIKGRTGTYNFILTAWDGQVSGGGGIDRFRIRIYDGAGQPIYDNQLGAPDNDNPTTALGGGSIVIHK